MSDQVKYDFDLTPVWQESTWLIDVDRPMLGEQGIGTFLQEVSDYASAVLENYQADLKLRDKNKRAPADVAVATTLLKLVLEARYCLDYVDAPPVKIRDVEAAGNQAAEQGRYRDADALMRIVHRIAKLLAEPDKQSHALQRARRDLTERDNEIRARRAQGEKRSVLAKEYGLNERTISRICKK